MGSLENNWIVSKENKSKDLFGAVTACQVSNGNLRNGGHKRILIYQSISGNRKKTRRNAIRETSGCWKVNVRRGKERHADETDFRRR